MSKLHSCVSPYKVKLKSSTNCVQENHHVAASLRLLRQDEFNWLKRAKPEVRRSGPGRSLTSGCMAREQLYGLVAQGFQNVMHHLSQARKARAQCSSLP